MRASRPEPPCPPCACPCSLRATANTLLLVGFPACDYNGFVNTARYSGMTLYDLSIDKPQIASYIRKNFKTDNSSQIRFYKGCVFLFSGNKGKAHTLVTVVNLMDEKELYVV